jgi:hypothetical protein
VNFIHRLLDSLDRELYYPEKTLNRIAVLVQQETGFEFDDSLVKTLEKIGLVSVEPDTRLVKRCDFTEEHAENLNPVIVSDSEFSFLVYPEIRYADAIELAQVMCVREAGATVRFELTRDSVVRAFDRGIAAAGIIDLLKRLSAGRISDTVVWTINEWEKRYSEVSLRRGLILTLSGDRQYLARTENLSGLIKETLAPGVYLVSDNPQEVTHALAAAGVDIVAKSESREKRPSGQNPFLPPLSLFGNTRRATREKIPPVISANPPAVSGLAEKFRAILEQMPLSKSEKSELAARIDRRLVLCESQLTGASVRFEKLEARFLDYAGKLGIAKQAIAQKIPVEVHWPGEEKTGSRVFGIPQSLEKEGNETFIVISCDEFSHEGANVLRIPLGKISLLRRIKKSIFEIT